MLLAFAVLTTALVQTNQDLDRTIAPSLRSSIAKGCSSFKAMERWDESFRRHPRLFLVVWGMQEAPSNHTYQLWFMDDGRPVSAGVFDVSDGLAVVEVDLSVEGFDGAAITVEPSGGSAEPRPHR